MQEREDPWGDGETPDTSSVSAGVTDVRKRLAYPTSPRLNAFREALPNLGIMVPGEEHFVPTMGFLQEEQVLMQLVRKVNAARQTSQLLSLPEWRSHIKGRLVVCVARHRLTDWEWLMEAIRNAQRRNRMAPPLSPEGNCFVPRLPMT